MSLARYLANLLNSSGQVVNSKIADVAASKITGTVADSQIAGVSGSKVSGAIPTGSLPLGTILQQVVAYSTTMASRNNSNFGEISAAYRVGITPKKSTSLLKIEFRFNTCQDTDHYTTSFRIIDVGSGAYVGSAPSSGSRPAGHCSARGQYNADNASSVTATAYVSSGSTNARTYGIEGRNASNFNMGFSIADRSDAWGWCIPIIMTITEFEQ